MLRKAIALAAALTAASIVSQIARGQEVEPSLAQPMQSSKIGIAEPLILQQSSGDKGVSATLIVDCSIPKTYLTLHGANGGNDIYSFDAEGVPTVDSTPPIGATSTPDLKKSVLQRMMRELGQRQLQDFSPDNLCRDGRPSRGAALAILRFVTQNTRELDI